MTRAAGATVYVCKPIRTMLGIYAPGLPVTVLSDLSGHLVLCMDNGFPNPGNPAHPCQRATVPSHYVADRPPPPATPWPSSFRLARINNPDPRTRPAS